MNTFVDLSHETDEEIEHKPAAKQTQQQMAATLAGEQILVPQHPIETIQTISLPKLEGMSYRFFNFLLLIKPIVL